MHHRSERKPGKSEEGTKNNGKQHLGDGVSGFTPVYWQEPTVPHSVWNDSHGSSVVGRARNQFTVRNRMKPQFELPTKMFERLVGR